MRQSSARRFASVAAVLISAFTLTGCFGSDGSTYIPIGPQPSTESGRAKVDNSSSPRRPTAAAKYLPDLSGASFQVDDIDLAAKTDPEGSAVGLIETAIGDQGAPRFEVTGVEATSPGTQIQKTIDVMTAAMRCLNQKGHLEMHAYVDTDHSYSMSVALVAKAKTYKNVDMRWCAVSSSVPYDQKSNPDAPTIAPCVSERTEGTTLIAWMGTTDVMCDAMGGDPVGPANRPLRRGNTGTDVAMLQLALNDIGADLTVDGRLGSGTTSAIRTFQGCFPVPDARKGVADAATKDALAIAQTSGWSKDECVTSP